ncbi:hypothetical protein BDP27DRAFT_1405309 [Rhodocollybia butyracea]|uniref:Uncharacterized protein n=1 Tax=Rhodocollybia butyracea TaxID=206335 RepID=A0A9P5PFU8_9AGAR|nr:hypothetical protein BDP27DRAFT_1405309 [Rhodocollybia butyracea]
MPRCSKVSRTRTSPLEVTTYRPDLDDVCNKLQHDNRVDVEGWKPHLRPSKSKAPEQAALQNLLNIYDDIHASRCSDWKTVDLTTPSSRLDNLRPDGFGVAKSPQQVIKARGRETERLNNWRELFHIFLALGSASHADLGFDATMRLVRIDPDRRPIYEIDMVDAEGSTRHSKPSVFIAGVVQASSLDKDGKLVSKPDDTKEFMRQIGTRVVDMSSYGDMVLAVQGALTGVGAMHDLDTCIAM